MSEALGVQVERLTVHREGTAVVDEVTFAVDGTEVVALVGPSGSGKTTILRALAGLTRPTSGTITIAGRDVTDLPPQQRDVAMVFEGATLQPHLDVERNLAFPLRLRRTPREEVRARVRAEARAFGLERLLRHLPGRLSQGERDAAATAHALVRPPSLLLVDEPLAGLDPEARRRARRQLVAVRSGYGVPMVLATNDQAEAATLADRIVVLHGGRVRQVGAYQELYDRPDDLVVARFVGSPPMNLLPVTATRRSGGALELDLAGWPVRLVGTVPATRTIAHAGVRPPDLEVLDPDAASTLPATVRATAFAGAQRHVRLELPGGEPLVAVVDGPSPRPGATVGLRPGGVHLFDGTGRAVAHDLRAGR